MTTRLTACALLPGVSFPSASRLFFQIPDKSGERWVEFDKCLRLDKGPDVLAQLLEDYEGGPIEELRCCVRMEGKTICEFDLTHLLARKPDVGFGLMDGLKKVLRSVDLPSLGTTAAGFVFGMLSAPDPLAAHKAQAQQVLARWQLTLPLTRAAIEARYKVLAMQHHPDHGGDERAFVSLQHEKTALLAMVQ